MRHRPNTPDPKTRGRSIVRFGLIAAMAIADLVSSAAYAKPPRKTVVQTPFPAAAKSKAASRPGTAGCAEFGPGFVRMPGSATCVRIGGGVDIGVGMSGR